MRLLAVIIMLMATVFLGAMGYHWIRGGSLLSAGAEVDQKLESIDRTTEPLHKELGDVGDTATEALDHATDNDDRT